MNKGWRGQGYRHSLAAKGIKTNNVYMKGRFKAAVGEALKGDDGSNNMRKEEVPDFSLQSKLAFAERVRAKAEDKLLTAQSGGDIEFNQIDDFWADDYRISYEDFKNKALTAEQFEAQVMMKVKRKTTPIRVAGVANEEPGSLLPSKEDSF